MSSTPTAYRRRSISVVEPSGPPTAAAGAGTTHGARRHKMSHFMARLLRARTVARNEGNVTVADWFYLDFDPLADSDRWSFYQRGDNSLRST